MSDIVTTLGSAIPAACVAAGKYISEAGQHIYNHYDKQCVTLNVKVEKNTRGYNFEVTVIGASSVDEAMALIKDAETKLRYAYTVGG